MERRSATRRDHERLACLPERMAHGLSGLRFSLTGHGAGVDDDELGLLGFDEQKTCRSEFALHTVRFNAVDPAPEIDNGNERIRHGASSLA